MGLHGWAMQRRKEDGRLKGRSRWAKGEEVERGGLRHGGGQFSEAEGDGDDEEAGDKPAEDPADVAA